MQGLCDLGHVTAPLCAICRTERLLMLWGHCEEDVVVSVRHTEQSRPRGSFVEHNINDG